MLEILSVSEVFKSHLAPTTAVLLCRMNFSIRMYIPAGNVERAAHRY
jgi:hypothetical protein